MTVPEDMKISVVIPCYNSEEFVEGTVRSALDQTHPAKEIICIDDGSTDGTLDLLRSIAEEENDLIVRSQANQGICGARNSGLGIADGKYVAFLDHDDLIQPRKLAHQVELIADCSFSPDFVAAAHTEVHLERGRTERRRPVHAQDPWTGLIHSRLGRTSSNLWRASSVQKVGAWDSEDGLELDTGLMFRLLKNGARAVADSVPLTIRYVRSTTASMGNRPEWWRSFLKMRSDILRHLKSNGCLNKTRLEALHVNMIRFLRKLYGHDPELALRMHRRLVQGNFQRSEASFGPGRLYRMLYDAIGFRYTEALYPLWFRIRTLFAR